MATRLVGRPPLDDGRHTRAMAIRISQTTLDRLRTIAQVSGSGSMAQIIGDLVERYVQEHGTPTSD